MRVSVEKLTRLKKFTNRLPSSVEDLIKLKRIEIRVCIPRAWWGKRFLYRNFWVKFLDQFSDFPMILTSLRCNYWKNFTFLTVANKVMLLTERRRRSLINGKSRLSELGQVVEKRELLQRRDWSHGDENYIISL